MESCRRRIRRDTSRSSGDDDRIVEGTERFGQGDQLIARTEAEHRNRGIQIDARGEGERDDAAEGGRQIHGSILRLPGKPTRCRDAGHAEAGSSAAPTRGCYQRNFLIGGSVVRAVSSGLVRNRTAAASISLAGPAGRRGPACHPVRRLPQAVIARPLRDPRPPRRRHRATRGRLSGVIRSGKSGLGFTGG